MKFKKVFLSSVLAVIIIMRVFSVRAYSASKQSEMHGVWIPYMSLTLSESERTEKGFQAKINEMAEKCAKYNINTAVIQVRPFSDAIYPSEIFPYSHIITGTQGIAPDFNPLEYIIKKFHEKNIPLSHIKTGFTMMYHIPKSENSLLTA